MVKIDPYLKTIAGISDEETAFEKLIETLLPTNRTPDFFVDWSKVRANVESNRIGISLLNSLITSRNRYEDMKSLLSRYSKEILPVIPLIIAVRDKNMLLVEKFEVGHLALEEFSFKKRNLSASEIEKHADFCRDSGILELFGEIKDLRDYLLGVEVGMDTNARKNRGGTVMERFVEVYLKTLSRRSNIDFLSQASSPAILQKWGVRVQVDKTNRRFDFAVFNPDAERLYLIEVNFYSGGGSKLKATAGEYIELNNFLKGQGLELIWITDGEGWKTTKNPLKETFHNNDYLLNINFMSRGLLEEIVLGHHR